MPVNCPSPVVHLKVLPASPLSNASASRMARKRFVVLILVQVMLLAHLAHWWFAGRSLGAIEPSESMETAKDGIITVGTILFVGALASTAVFGRWFCGWGCHIIFLQDACSLLLERFGLRPKPFRSRALLWLPFLLAVYMFLWPIVYRLAVAPIVQPELRWPGLSMRLATDDLWRTFPGWAVGVPFVIVCAFLTIVFLGNKGYCTYACPYGGFFAPLERVARGRIRVNDSCEGCGHCTAVCSSNVRVHEEVRDFGMVVDPGCMKCMDCVAACPKEALSFGFGPGPAGAVPAAARLFDLTVAEEVAIGIVAAVSFAAAYSILPLLFASGVAACTVYTVWTGWCVVSRRDAAALGVSLKRAGRVRAAGVAVVLAALVACAVAVSTAAAGCAAWRANAWDRSLKIIEPVVFNPDGLDPDIETREFAASATRWYSRARSWGLGGWAIFSIHDREYTMRMAWLAAVVRDHARALELLRGLQAEGNNEVVSANVARVLRAARLDDEATAHVAAELKQYPLWEAMRDEDILWLLDKSEDARAFAAARAWRAAMPTSLTAMRRLSILLVERGQSDEEVHEGLDLIDQTLVIAPGNVGAMLVKANGLARLGMNNQAVEVLHEATRLAPTERALWEALADACARAGREMEAQAALAEAERLVAHEQQPAE